MRVLPRSCGPRIVLALLVLVVVLVVAAADRLVWQPKVDSYRRTDAVVVLGGPDFDRRYALGRELASRYDIPLAVSVLTVKFGFCKHLKHHPAPPLCFHPDPSTTQGEARWTAQEARSKGWRSVTVVVTVDQVARARLRMERCGVRGLRMAAASTSIRDRLTRTPYQLGAFVKAEVWQRGC